MTEDNTQAARDLADRFWDRILEIEPLVGTYIGDERYDDRLGDPSDEGLARRREICEGSLKELASIDRQDLDVDLRTTLDVLEAGCRRELESVRYRMDRLFAVSHLFGPGALLASLGSLQRADTPDRLDRYVARLSDFPRYLDATSAVAMEGAAAGQTMPRLVVDRAVGQVERLLSLAPHDSPAMQPVAGAADADRERVSDVVRDVVWPAYQRYLDALKDYRPSARDSIGLSALADGDGMYAAQILGFTTLVLDPKDVHQTGNEQLGAILDERRTIAERLGHPDAEAALAEYTGTGKNTASSREQMLEHVRAQVERSWEAAPRFFGRLPRANCIVKPVEEFQEDDVPGAYYNPPTADGSRPGIYYVNTGHLDGRPLHQTATTSFHEANPGHHFQLSIEMEFTDRLPLRRFGGFLVGDSLVEGWGLYSERLADEMGLFLDDHERLGMLEAQAFRAGRLIVDTGIHALGWDRERAVRKMEETGSSRVDSEIEVDRYIAMPGQALAYMIGKLEIDRWRDASRDREGTDFSLQGFHDRVLSLGSLPLNAVARELGVAPR